jgi:hypothetical protein
LRTAWLRTSISRFSSNLIHLSVSLIGHSSTIPALVDCGSTLNFINENLVSTLRLNTEQCASTQVVLADGRILAHSNRQVTLKISIAGIPQTHTFLVAPIGVHSLILGMPWLEDTNPAINWKLKSVQFDPNVSSSSSPAPLSESLSEPLETLPRPEISPLPQDRRMKKQKSKTLPNGNSPRTPSTVRLTTQINSNDQVYVLHLDGIVSLSEYLSAAHEAAQNDLPPIPKEYADLAEVFSKQKAHELAPHRGPLDHHIHLEKDSKPVFGPIYNLSETELQVLKQYIEENLQRNFIRPSTSPFGAPVLFVKKPDGSLRLCVDYRALNRMTIKNRYPLPLISELLDRVKGARFFTKIDVRDAFNRLRIALGDEHKTAFRTRYGHFEYLVMPFGLTNAPGSFQAYINDIIRDALDRFAVAYMDDILIYSNSLEEHILHVRTILQKLLSAGLFVKLEKCEFHVQKVSFLGFIITPEGISMDPERILTIADWPVPESVLDIQVFLGFCNFYRRFIEGYSRVVLPITRLLRKGQRFIWSAEAQSAFDQLKASFTSAPILAHFDPKLPVTLHADSSGFAISGIVSQPDANDVLHPVAFWSRKCIPAECNYDIHDREMLAIVECFKHWRHYLEGSLHPVHVRSDHKNLETFMTTKILNRRQARWAEILSGYDFVLDHIPGSKNPADGPSRRPDYAKDADIPSGALIPPKALRLLPTESLPPGVRPAPSDVPGAHLETTWSQPLESISAFVSELSLREQIISALLKDPVADEQRLDPQSPWSWDNGLLLRNNLIYVPEDNSLRLELMRQHHDDPLAGHFGIPKTFELLSRNYWFPRMHAFVKSYIASCDLCSRGKPSRHPRHGELAPLPAPSGPWKSVSCDFIVDLPISNGFDSILVFVDRLTKMTHLVPCHKTTDAPEFARMFLDNVIRLHGIPQSLVSDRGSIFTSHFWKSLASMMNLKRRLSTAFHPQTDGQTERMNQTLEQYLRMYCNYQQDNWTNLLSLAEFALNNAHQPTINCSPFYANYGFHPTFTINPRSPSMSVPAAKALADNLQSHHSDLIESIKSAQNHQARYYDAKHKRIEFSVGDKVWLSSLNIQTQRPSKKLDWKRLGPFTILERIGTQAYRLQLPPSIKIHPVFHVSLLEPHTSSTIPHRTQPPPPPVVVVDSSELEYEVEDILDSKYLRNRLFYLIKWKGYDPSDNSWEPASSVKNSPRLVEAFHSKYPNRPKPATR